jgi:hypothetical protein
MPSLEQFSRRINEVAERVEQGSTRLVRKVAIAIQQTVMLATPVDTGRARANWEVSTGAPVFAPTERTDFSAKSAENTSVIATYQSGDKIFLSNNVPYIGELNRGSSAQAPAGFVIKAVRTAANAVAKGKVLVK